jgi:hypothetical protein
MDTLSLLCFFSSTHFSSIIRERVNREPVNRDPQGGERGGVISGPPVHRFTGSPVRGSPSFRTQEGLWLLVEFLGVQISVSFCMGPPWTLFLYFFSSTFFVNHI